jgi:hypothetical protein
VQGTTTIGNNMEGCGRGLIDVLSPHLPGETEDNKENLQSG